MTTAAEQHRKHLRRVEAIHQQDVSDGYGRIELPHALARKYPNANREWRRQFVFPQERRWRNPQTGEQGRHHVDESTMIYTHVLNRGARGVRSPADVLARRTIE